MFPNLFTVAGVKIDAYYVLWALGLSIMILWSRRRAVDKFSISYNDATDILFYVFVGGMVGAVVGGYLTNIPLYLENPRAILNYRIVGLSSAPGILGAGAAGFWKLRRLNVPANPFADATSIPAAFLMAVGRLGCFSAGCCYGIETDSPLGVHFPFLQEGVHIYPTQLFESLAAFLIGGALIAYERSERAQGKLLQGILFALFMIGYGGYRLVFDSLRGDGITDGLRAGQISGFFALLLGIAWLVCARKRQQKYKQL